ncbi:SPOR domain-containing protein [Alisedimentitalea sp. MJ-SS2]|uniref:SPOR domain-containing protein n=1 Tax=Aliisedimentitalea sp. MJ-SS2 TaxID=3049795 RepID=UPI002908A436|nr:SPOR domain-containing protein [Alisedimentitalea sp. MJ-SS2]MDU8927351.1 SPOR domain-containing protein [Alisedimentitalea sp. MJ-SS2]
MLAVTLVATLTACSEGGQFGDLFKKQSSAEDAVTRAKMPGLGGKTVERDVEAPEVFQAKEAGLWDGRPSLGGVWVAHPDVNEPERVIIRNDASGKFVVGALFRRERENPGPRLQVSSDAADALGMLAGQPMKLDVVALRREAVAEEPPVQEATAETLDAPAEIEAKPLDPIASAAAAIDQAENATPASQAASETQAAPEKKKWKLFSKKAKAEATPASAIVTEAPLTALKPQPVVATAAKATPKPSGLAKPFIQIGIFSVEKNASNTGVAMSQAGMVPTVKKQKIKGKPYWRVLVGPANTSAERGELLKKVKASGFTDAYFVTN